MCTHVHQPYLDVEGDSHHQYFDVGSVERSIASDCMTLDVGCDREVRGGCDRGRWGWGRGKWGGGVRGGGGGGVREGVGECDRGNGGRCGKECAMGTHPVFANVRQKLQMLC